MRGKEDFTGVIDGAGYKAARENIGKTPVDLIWPGFVLGTGRVLGQGAHKYSRGNWMRGLRWCEVLAAIMRHTLAIIAGEDVDPESGEPHVYHIAAEAMFLAWYQDGPRRAEYTQFDDRIFRRTAPPPTPHE